MRKKEIMAKLEKELEENTDYFVDLSYNQSALTSIKLQKYMKNK